MLMPRLAWRNIWRQPRRTWLTLGAMVFANIILVFMISLQNGMYAMMINNTLRLDAGHYQIQAEDYHDHPAMYKTVNDGRQLAFAIRHKIGEFASARANAFVLLASDQRTYGAQLFGVEVEHEPQISSLPGLVTEGRYLGSDDAHEIVIGKVLARNLKVGIGDELTLLGSGKDGSIAADVVTVTGLFETGNNDADRLVAHMPLSVFQQVFSMGDAVHAIVITSDSIRHSDELIKTIDLPVDSVLLNWQQLVPGLMQAIKADISSAAFIYFILIMLSGFSVLNTVLMAVLERTREFGIFMALGLRPTQLAKLIFLETGLLAFIGLILGAMLGGLVTWYFEINGMYIPGYEEMATQFNMPARMYPDVDLLTLSLGPLFVFISAVIAAIYPAVKLMALKPLEAMHDRP